MKLIESYALNCGLKIGKPYIYEQFFATPWPNYILLHAGGGMNSKKYDYYQEVVDILKPLVGDLKIVQIGDKGEKHIQGCVNLLGQTTIHQTAYLIRQADLLIGNDSCNTHIASGFGTPVVSLYGPTTPHNHGPAFSDKWTAITADLLGEKPSYSAEEQDKTVNRITPEAIVKAALRWLGISDEKVTRETLFVGPNYNQAIIECLPNQVLPADFVPNIVPAIRMDYLFDEEIMCQMLSVRPYSIVTDKPINVDLLRKYKAHIKHVLYDVKPDFSAKFIADVRSAGIPYAMASLLRDEELAKAKLGLFDYGVIVQRLENGAEFRKNNEWTVREDLCAKTNRILISNGKVFLSKYHADNGLSTNGIDDRVCTVPQDDSFFDFSENLYIFKM